MRRLNCHLCWIFLFCMGLCHFINHRQGEGGSDIKSSPCYYFCSNNLLSNKQQSKTKDHINLASWKHTAWISKKNMNLSTFSQNWKTSFFNYRHFYVTGFWIILWILKDDFCIDNKETLAYAIPWEETWRQGSEADWEASNQGPLPGFAEVTCPGQFLGSRRNNKRPFLCT